LFTLADRERQERADRRVRPFLALTGDDGADAVGTIVKG